MTTHDQDLHGVYAAAVTPLTDNLEPDLDALPALLDFLAGHGCHGALLLGTTGEGPAFSVAERVDIMRAALRHRAAHQPGLKLLAGTGCASLTDTIAATRAAFDLGIDAALALPAFFYKSVSPSGLARYFEHVIEAAVPSDGRLLVYHIPQVAGVGVPDETLRRLLERYPRQMWGMKDSQDHLPHTQQVLRDFPALKVFAGSDSIMSDALSAGAAGAITALANITAPLNRQVWDAHQRGTTAPEAQARLTRARQVTAGLNGSAVQKFALAEFFGLPHWPVRPPLEDLAPEVKTRLAAELGELLEPLPQ